MLTRGDLIITTKHMLAMEGEGVGYKENYALAIKDGEIIDVLPIEEARNTYEAFDNHEFKHHVILPGFVDAHMHGSNAMFRGLAQDTNRWMMEGYMPFGKHLTEKAGVVATKLAYAEALRNGTTCFSDFEYPMEEAAEVAFDLGVRALITSRIRSVPNKPYGPGELYEFDEALGEKTFEEAVTLASTWHGRDNGRIRVALGPQGVDFVHEDLLKRIFKKAKEMNLKVHMHLQQGDRETEQIEKRHGMKPIAYLDKLGLIDETLMAVHLTDANDEEAALVANRGASMILCPGSIAIIDGLVPPALSFMEAGGVVGLGSDQAPGNNCHNMFNEMKLACLLNKCKTQNPEVMPSYKALRMATIEGAKTIGFDDIIGSLEKGKRADFIAVNLNALTMQPVIVKPLRNIVPNLVYSARGPEVSHVYVDGKNLLREGRYQTISERDLLREVEHVKKELFQVILNETEHWEGRQFELLREDKL